MHRSPDHGKSIHLSRNEPDPFRHGTRLGHTPSGLPSLSANASRPGLESAPLQITPEEPKKGLHWAAVEVPSGVRGRMALYGPMVEECDAAIIINNADLAFGCMGCAGLTNSESSAPEKNMPKLELEYPRNEEEGTQFVAAIKRFLVDLGGKK